MSPYTQFQERLIEWLQALKNSEPVKLREIIDICRSPAAPYTDWPKVFQAYGYPYEREHTKWHEYREHNLWEIILEQIDDSGDEIQIIGVLGMRLWGPGTPITSYAEWKKLGNSVPRLRTEKFVHVTQLKKGDVLLSGEELLFPPREGGNGSVLLCLSDGEGRPGLWFDYPARTILPLIACAAD